MRVRHVLLGLAIAVAILVARLVFTGAEAQVLRRMDELADRVSRTGPEDQLVAAARARGVADMFTPDCQAADLLTGETVRGRGDIARVTAWVRESLGPAVVSFESVEVVLDGEVGASTRAVARVRGQEGGLPGYDRSQLTFEWVRRQGRWLVRSVVVDRPEDA